MDIFNVRYPRVVESFRKSFRFYEHFYEKKKKKKSIRLNTVISGYR